MSNRLSFEEFLLIAEATLEKPYDDLERAVCPFRADYVLAAPFFRVCGSTFISDPVEQAASSAFLIIRLRPLPPPLDNKGVAYECMREMLVRSGFTWSPSEEEADAVVETLQGVEAGTVDLAEFIRWVRSRATA